MDAGLHSFRLLAAAAAIDGKVSGAEKVRLLQHARELGVSATEATHVLHEVSQGGSIDARPPTDPVQRRALMKRVVALLTCDGRTMAPAEHAFLDSLRESFGYTREQVQGVIREVLSGRIPVQSPVASPSGAPAAATSATPAAAASEADEEDEPAGGQVIARRSGGGASLGELAQRPVVLVGALVVVIAAVLGLVALGGAPDASDEEPTADQSLEPGEAGDAEGAGSTGSDGSTAGTDDPQTPGSGSSGAGADGSVPAPEQVDAWWAEAESGVLALEQISLARTAAVADLARLAFVRSGLTRALELLETIPPQARCEPLEWIASRLAAQGESAAFRRVVDLLAAIPEDERELAQRALLRTLELRQDWDSLAVLAERLGVDPASLRSVREALARARAGGDWALAARVAAVYPIEQRVPLLLALCEVAGADRAPLASALLGDRQLLASVTAEDDLVALVGLAASEGQVSRALALARRIASPDPRATGLVVAARARLGEPAQELDLLLVEVDAALQAASSPTADTLLAAALIHAAARSPSRAESLLGQVPAAEVVRGLELALAQVPEPGRPAARAGISTALDQLISAGERPLLSLARFLVGGDAGGVALAEEQAVGLSGRAALHGWAGVGGAYALLGDSEAAARAFGAAAAPLQASFGADVDLDDCAALARTQAACGRPGEELADTYVAALEGLGAGEEAGGAALLIERALAEGHLRAALEVMREAGRPQAHRVEEGAIAAGDLDLAREAALEESGGLALRNFLADAGDVERLVSLAREQFPDDAAGVATLRARHALAGGDRAAAAALLAEITEPGVEVLVLRADLVQAHLAAGELEQASEQAALLGTRDPVLTGRLLRAAARAGHLELTETLAEAQGEDGGLALDALIEVRAWRGEVEFLAELLAPLDGMQGLHDRGFAIGILARAGHAQAAEALLREDMASTTQDPTIGSLFLDSHHFQLTQDVARSYVAAGLPSEVKRWRAELTPELRVAAALGALEGALLR
jgi:hypothetical protein